MSSRRHLHRNLVVAAVASFLLGASSVHCSSGGSSPTNTFTGSGTSNGGSASTASTMSAMGGSSSTLSGGLGGQVGFDVQVADYSAEQIYANDPPQMTCGDSGVTPPPVGGTPTCPSDKNLPGCICAAAGMTASCWTGLRKDRGNGDCKDGTTTCTMNSESTLVWGPCVGETLPVMGATGAAACECFSKGYWKIANLSPCFVTDGSGTVTEGIATDATTMQCPSDFTTPPTNWSTDTLTVDCAGTFTLCYTIKAGNPKMPMPTDCVMEQTCVTASYTTPNVEQTLPDLPGWVTTGAQTACAQQFYNTGGYGEMSVNGQSIECEMVSKVFQRVTYCPLSCNTNPTGPGCVGCMAGGGGSF